MQDIIHHITIHAPASRVYMALTTPLGIGSWWTQNSTFGAKRGSAAGFAAPKVVTTIRIDELTPPTHVLWTVLTSNAPGHWPGSTITFDLKANGNDTELSFAHHGLSGNEGYERIKKEWATYMHSLKQYIERGSMQR